jgi:hypothetical protein
MLLPWSIILQAGGKVKQGWGGPVLWISLVLVGTLIIGAIVIAVADRWRKRPGSERLTPGEQLAHFRALYDRGELSREEFERIRNLLGEQLRRDLHVPGAPQAQPAPPSAQDTPVQAQPPSDRPPPPDGAIQNGPPPENP